MNGVHKDANELRDRINSAFRALQGDGYFAEANFWCCQSCGCAAIPEENAKKYVFYHEQDHEQIMEEGECYLAWAGDGVEICRRLTEAKLAVSWNNDPHTRILVKIPTVN